MRSHRVSSEIESPDGQMDLEAKNALWREVVGDDMLIPAVNSNVLYRARLHFEQTDGLADEMNQVLPATIPGFVSSVQLEFAEGSGYPLVKFLLAPRQGEDGNRDGRGHNFLMEGIGRQHAFEVYEKEVSLNEIGGTCQLKKVGANFFPHDTVKAFVVFGDGSEHGFSFKNGKFSGGGWNEFVKDKQMMVGDGFVFLKRRQGGDVFLGLKRALPPSSSGQLVVDAARLAAKGSNFWVYYFPHLGRPTCVDHD